ncbi:ribonuclease T2 [Rhizobium sp. SL42]|uniref:ribonuclease T2 n=1 Tax=Rhizobium sp. SL42 TaxID=2806346 RepID=UPI001F1D6082|nr:ribonuclease T2 [Rhizobium sp. SL42]UJW73233.1 ribonuclease T2 [Rhizobium sp. SL42]
MRFHAGFLALGAMTIAALVYGLAGEYGPADSTTDAVVSVQKPVAAPSEPKSVKPRVGTDAKVPQGTGFDFYVLSLSWSPTFCQSNGASRNREQCGQDKRFGLIVHGLWPQYERGFPESCPTDQPQQVPRSLGRQVIDVMPGMGLIGHEWRKHGTCSGLDMADYFSVLRQAYDNVRIPDVLRGTRHQTRTSPQALEDAFMADNPGLSRSAVAVTCDNQRLDEVRICFSKSLEFRACPEVDARACRRSELTIPPLPQ